MSRPDRPQDDKDKAPATARSVGRSGKGAASAMKQLREWEQRRARAEGRDARPSQD